MKKQGRRYDAMVRWQETRIKQFSYVNYLILTLALATLGFLVDAMAESQPLKFAWRSWVFWLRISPLVLVSISIWAGILCAYSRLMDFRKTSEITRLKYRYNGYSTKRMEKLRCQTSGLGECSWCLLGFQIWLFAAGLLLFMYEVMRQFIAN